MIFRRKDNDGFVASSFWGRLTSPFRSVGRFFGETIQGSDSLDVKQSWMARVVGLVTLPFRFCLGCLIFMIQAWTSSRPGFAFVRAIPAMTVMMAFFIALLAADYIHNEGNRISTNAGYYDFHLKRSSDHPEYAEIFAEKLVMLQPENLNYKYELGRVLELKGESFKALDIMKSLAPDDRPGFDKAHTWLASYYIREDSQNEGNSHSELIRRHLAFAIEASPENQIARFTLAKLGIAEMDKLEKGSDEYRAQLNSVIENLVEIADAPFTGQGIGIQLAVIPKLLELQRERGDEEVAKRRLQNELFRLNELAQRLPSTQSMEIRKVMIRTALSVKDYAKVTQFINEAQQVAKTRESLRQLSQLRSLAYRQRAGDFSDMTDRKQYSSRLSYLCIAIIANPLDPIAGEQILEFIVPKKQNAKVGADPDRANQVSQNKSNVSQSEIRLDWLRGFRTDNAKSMSLIHILLGINEISNGNISEGEKHWRIADNQARNMQLIVNQLVQVAAIRRPGDFSNELDMISLAIELFPEPVFYQTRGVFLKNLGRYEEAVTDLAYAIGKLPNSIDRFMTHNHLIACYEKLGEETKAIEQQSQFQQELNQLPGPTRKQVEVEIQRRSTAQ